MRRFHGKLITYVFTAAFACALLLGSTAAFASDQVVTSCDDTNAAILGDGIVMSDDSVVMLGDSEASGRVNADASGFEREDAVLLPSDVDSATRQVHESSVTSAASRQAVTDEGELFETPLTAMASSDTVDMYRLYNPNSGEHFYTGDWSERTHLVDVGWVYEGIGWVAPKTSNSPVYRLYNPNAGDHHYTLAVDERDYLKSVGWRYEGVGWYSDDKMRIPILRQYNPNAKAGAHNFTSSSEENKALVETGWRAEGVGWYAISGAQAVPTPVSGSRIYLDAGHGTGSSAKNVYDSGACGNGYEEAKLTAELVTLVAKYARDLYGLNVYSNVDGNVEYWNRQADAKERGCTSLVSVHFNAADGGGTGTESYIHNNHAAARANELQSIMHKALVKGTGLRDRGMKSAGLAVCSGYSTGIPATLLEVCFIDNSYDMKQYQAKKDVIARELAAGLFEAAQSGF